MPPESAVPESEYRVIAEQWARAKRDGTIVEGAGRPTGRQATATDRRNETQEVPQKEQQQQQRQQQQQQKQAAETPNQQRRRAFDRRWRWTVAFWACLLAMHAGAIWLFTSGFLLTRLVLDDISQCGQPPLDSHLAARRVDAGCWHPKMFDRAIVFVIDALRYDFAVPVAEAAAGGRHYLNALPFLHETAVTAPHNAFLRPFIADPPTTTLQRLKGLTTGTLPTFIDAGSNFAGTAIEEDNLLLQLRGAGKKIVHLGDDTWTALFPGHFEANLSRAYDSFDVWDLHTVDKGVMDHMLPLVGQRGRWDVLIGHCLGVDHAGHRYGPDHPAMGAKLREMDGFVRELTAAIDDDTLLVVIGDHGMDTKGDHGGESDDEVQAALWMYAKRPVFGRTAPEHATPPATAKTRPVDQIDLVPTLALLLGIPIPYNSLGRPIEEAFAGGQGSDWANLAAVTRMAAAGTQRYQGSYFAARGLDQDDGPGSASQLWARAQAAGLSAREAYEGAARSQEETLRLCRRLWARFDVPRMAAGVALAAAGVAVLVAYALRYGPDGDGAGRPGRLVPRGFWGWMAVVFTVGHALGFASNSFTVWEDSVLLFLLATFGVAAAAASLRTAARAERAAAVYHALGFAGLGRLAWYSKLCREEQMAYCTSTYYASAASSTSAPWQLAVPFAVAAVLPPVVKSFLVPTRSYAGLAPAWIGYGFRAGLLLSAVYWVVDAADNGGWLGSRVPAGALKTAGVTLAQMALALALVAGTVAFAWAPPSVEVVRMAPVSGQRRVAIMGYANALGARYLLLPLNVLAGCLVLSKPMGAGALALMLWQVLSLAEVLDRTGLKAAPIGPVVLAMMGNFYFFRTGHQAVLSSIQWDSAFVALTRLRYPWAPLAVALNTFAGQAVAAASLPLLVLWKTEPRQRGVLGAVARAAAVFGAYYAVEAVASMACAAWLRRHLMLFRVFSPRFMMAAALLLLVNLLVLLVALTGVRTSMLSVGDVFGWPES